MKLIINNSRIAAIASTAHVASGMDQAVIDAPEGFDPERLDDYRWTGERLTGPGIWETISEHKAERKAALSAKMWAVADGGITVAGMAVKTDEESRSLINGAHNLALRKTDVPGYTLDFKGADGWVKLTAAQMVAVAEAVGIHVQECFSKRRALEAAIDAADTHEAVAAVDINSGW